MFSYGNLQPDFRLSGLILTCDPIDPSDFGVFGTVEPSE